jgi:hypothetical protein
MRMDEIPSLERGDKFFSREYRQFRNTIQNDDLKVEFLLESNSNILFYIRRKK